MHGKKEEKSGTKAKKQLNNSVAGIKSDKKSIAPKCNQSSIQAESINSAIQ